MASKGGKHHSKKSSKKSGFKKTTGGSSYKNYSKKQKNLDYKYRIMDIQDVNQSKWYEQARATYQRVLDISFADVSQVAPQIFQRADVNAAWVALKGQATKFYTALINCSCHFIPISTSQLIAKNMSVNIRSRYPFAYCLFQNTKEFRKVILQYCTSDLLLKSEVSEKLTEFETVLKNAGVTAEQMKQIEPILGPLDGPLYFNPFGLADSGFVIPMLRHTGNDLTFLENSQQCTSAIWGQICRSQSSYREYRSPDNSGIYCANVNAYYSKASTYLTTSTGKSAVTRGYRDVEVVRTGKGPDWNNFYAPQLVTPARNDAYWASLGIDPSYRDKFYDTMFNQGDMILCVLPCYYLSYVDPQNTEIITRPALTGNAVTINLIPSLQITRHYYVLNQDVGIQEVQKQFETATLAYYQKTVYQNSTIAAASNIGNIISLDDGIVRNIHDQSKGLTVKPLLRMDVDQLAQQTNCVVVDQNCYDSENQELELQAYMDLQPVPANVGEQILEDIEGPETMNCNAVVSCGNNADEQKCFDATVSNTGPKCFAVSDNSSYFYNSSSTYAYTNFGYGYNKAQTYLQYISQGTANIPYQYHYLMSNGTQGYNVDYDKITRYMQYVNSMIDFRLIIPRFSPTDNGGTFSFASCHEFGFQPTGSSGKTYLLAVLPFGFSYEGGGTDVYLEYLEPCLCVVGDGQEAQNVVQYTPIAYQAIMNLYRQAFVTTTTASNQITGQYPFNALCGLKYDDSTDPAYSSQMGQYIHTDDIYDYLVQWTNDNVSQANKTWKKIKGFFSKVAKFIRGRAIPLVKKVTQAVAPIVPAPYGTIVSAVGSTVTTIDSTLNLISAKKNNNESSVQAVQDDTVEDYFTVIPQYRLSDSNEAADIADQGEDWVDGESMTIPVNQYGSAVSGIAIHKLNRHPNFEYIRSRLQGVNVADTDIGAYCQQRIKVVFRKRNVTPAIAKGYKAVLALGCDTNYLADDDYQVVSETNENQYNPQ